MVLTKLHASAIWRLLQRQSAGSTNRQIAGAAATVGVATALVSLVSVARELLVAASFGTSDALDAFVVAILLPTYILNVVGGSVGSALIPTYVRVHDREGPEEAERALSSVVALCAGLLLLAAIFLAIASSTILPMLASGFVASKLHLTQQLFVLFLPVVVFGGVASIWSSVLNAKDRFALVAFSQVLIPISAILALIIGREWGIFALMVGMVGGFALRLGALGWELSRLGVPIVPRWHGVSPAVSQIGVQYAPLVAASALFGGTALIDQAVAASLEPGSVAALGYGTKVVLLATGLGAAALGTAVMPFFSRMVAASEWDQLRHSLRTFSLIILVTTIPVVVLLSVFSVPIVELLYQRGAFTTDDTEIVARIQALYALQLPFFGVGILYSRVISSLGANRLLLWQAVVCLISNAVLALLLSRFLGVAGIALATSAMYAIALGYLFVMGQRTLASASH